MPDKSSEFGQFAQHLGMTLEHEEVGLARTRVKVQPYHMHGGGVMQGGRLVTLADFAMARALVLSLQPGQSTTTIEFKVNFMWPGLLGEELEAEAKVVQSGKTIAVIDVEVRSLTSGKVLLKGMGTSMFLDAPQGRAKKS